MTSFRKTLECKKNSWVRRASIFENSDFRIAPWIFVFFIGHRTIPVYNLYLPFYLVFNIRICELSNTKNAKIVPIGWLFRLWRRIFHGLSGGWNHKTFINWVQREIWQLAQTMGTRSGRRKSIQRQIAKRSGKGQSRTNGVGEDQVRFGVSLGMVCRH